MKYSSALRKTANLSESIHQQLGMYALAASAAGVGVLALTQPAEARIIYTHVNATIQHVFPLDLNHDGKVDFYLSHSIDQRSGGTISTLRVCHTGINCTSSMLGSNASSQVRGSSRGGAVALRAGARIQNGYRFLGKDTLVPMGARRFSTHSSKTSWSGQWVNGGKGVKNRYLGLKFKIKGRFHFGWARLTVTTTKGGFTVTLTGYAYETTAGKPIKAGQTKEAADAPTTRYFGPSASLTNPIARTPQPASLGMLALGAQQLPLRWRNETLPVTN